MSRVRLLGLLLFLALVMSSTPPTALATTETAAVTASPQGATIDRRAATAAKMRAVAQTQISPTTVKAQVAKAKKSVAKYRKLLPKGHKLRSDKIRAFRVSDTQVVISVTISTKGYPGGAFSFIFTGKKLKSSQQLILKKGKTTATVRLYTNGKLTKKATVGLGTTGAALTLQPQNGSGDPFTDCWNSMPGWVLDLISLLCTVSCLSVASPPSLVICITCVIGLAGAMASFALKCAGSGIDL